MSDRVASQDPLAVSRDRDMHPQIAKVLHATITFEPCARSVIDELLQDQRHSKHVHARAGLSPVQVAVSRCVRSRSRFMMCMCTSTMTHQCNDSPRTPSHAAEHLSMYHGSRREAAADLAIEE